jgi:hypothetical protein
LTVKKVPVTRPTKSGGLSTYIQSYNSSSKELNPAKEFINSLKIRNNILNKYNLSEYLKNIKSLNKLTIYDVFFISSKIKSIIDIEIIVNFLNKNILDIDLLIICSIINNIPTKFEYYEILIKEFVSNKKIEKYNLISILYSLNDHNLLISVLSKIKKFEQYIIHPLSTIYIYNKEINIDCFSAMVNSFYNIHKPLKFLSNGINLSTIENKLLNDLIKNNNKIVLKTVDKLYSYLFINMNVEIAAHIYKNNININIDYNFDGFFEFERKQKKINKIFKKIKDVSIKSSLDFLIIESGFYLSENNECYMIIELELIPPQLYGFDFISVPNQLGSDKFLICSR